MTALDVHRGVELDAAKAAREAAIRETILGWNLDQPKAHLVRTGGYQPSEVDELEREYKRFLILAVESPVPLPISGPVDPMWHEHVLFTRDYDELKKRLGHALHHNPHMDDAEVVRLNAVYAAETLPRYEQNFGKPDERFWPNNNAVCMCCDC